jgi:hypothetical protein
VDQNDARQLRDIIGTAFGGRPLDLVVDDASHLVEPTRTTFNCLFPRLAPGGVYLIEDWAWAHSYLGTRGEWANQQPLTRVILELVLACACRPEAIANVNVFKNCVIVERGPLAIDPETFELTKSYGPRAAALLPDSN